MRQQTQFLVVGCSAAALIMAGLLVFMYFPKQNTNLSTGWNSLLRPPRLDSHAASQAEKLMIDAVALSRAGRYREAEKLLRRSVHIKEVSLGPSHASLITDLSLLTARFAPVTPQKLADRKRLIQIEQLVLGENAPDAILNLLWLTNDSAVLGNENATRAYLRTLLPGSHSSQLLTSAVDVCLAYLDCRLGDQSEARSTAAKAYDGLASLSQSRKSQPQQYVLVWYFLHLGDTFFHLGLYKQASNCYELAARNLISLPGDPYRKEVKVTAVYDHWIDTLTQRRDYQGIINVIEAARRDYQKLGVTSPSVLAKLSSVETNARNKMHSMSSALK